MPQGVRVHAYLGDVPIVQPLVRVDAQACPYPAPFGNYTNICRWMSRAGAT